MSRHVVCHDYRGIPNMHSYIKKSGKYVALSFLQEIIITVTHHEVVEYNEQCTQEISSWVEAVNDLM